MKSFLVVMALALSVSSAALADSTVLNGKDDQGKPCSLELVGPEVVRTGYSGSLLFKMTAGEGAGTLRSSRMLTTASTQARYDLLFDGNRNAYSYSESRVNLRTGEVFFEVYRVCELF